jgi:hypothetical protein
MLYFRGHAETRKCATKTEKEYERSTVLSQAPGQLSSKGKATSTRGSSIFPVNREGLEKIIGFRLARRMANTSESAYIRLSPMMYMLCISIKYIRLQSQECIKRLVTDGELAQGISFL